jgi:uncharacterized membrane protein YqjE
MHNAAAEGPGLVASIRTLAAGMVDGVRDRIELLAVEVQQEKFRLVQILIWIAAAVFAAAMCLAFASLTLVYLLWESARLAALGGLALFYGAALVGIIVGFRRYLAKQPKPFSGTVQELTEDSACIRKRS